MAVIDEKSDMGVAEEKENAFPLNDHVSEDGAKEENIGLQLPDINSVAEKKLIRKLDLHLVPVVMLLYLLSYLDRINIGNARFGNTISQVRIYLSPSRSRAITQQSGHQNVYVLKDDSNDWDLDFTAWSLT